MKLLVGLGNVGPRYAATRHNIGFMVVDELAADAGATWKDQAKFKAVVTEIELAGQKVVLAKPATMMNNSGEAIQRLMQFYKVQAGDVWVLYDDVDVPFGRLRLRVGGSSGGHQGLNSTVRHIGSGFVRARLGISLNDRAVEPSEVYVLKPFKPEEQTKLPQLIAAAAGVITDQLVLETPAESTFDLI